MAARARLADFELTRDLMALVRENFNEVRGEIRAFEAKVTKSRGPDDSPDERRKLNRVVVNHLTSVRLYMDHRQRELARRPVRNPELLEAFQKAREEVESKPIYWFVWVLRNYVQHTAMPLQVITAEQNIIGEGEDERVETRVMVGCRRSELLDYRDRGNEKKWIPFLEAQLEEFPILPSLETVTDLLWRIERSTVAAILPQLWSDGRSIVQLLSEATDKEGSGLVVESRRGLMQVPNPTGTFGIAMPPLNILGWLGLIKPAGRETIYTIQSDRLSNPVPPLLK